VRIVVGITGGIAAYKAVSLIRLLSEAGHDVKVVPTQNALRFVGAATLEAISHNTVDPDLYTDVADVKHIQLGQTADLVIVAPATASFLARTAAGIADDLLSNVILATKAPVLIAPAMHTEMWENPATQRNVATLVADGYALLEPGVGRLTGDDTGKGRLPEPEVIARAALKLLSRDLDGKHIVVTAGGTREPIDPVRFIGNSSSGKQGLALAKEAQRRGARVTLIAANLAEAAVGHTIHVETAAELSSAMDEALQEADALIMAAAVSDFRVAEPNATKIKKREGENVLDLRLIRNDDLLANAALKASSATSKPIFIGFAAETLSDKHDLERAALQKLETKHCDIVVANDVSGGDVFGSEENSVTIVGQSLRTQRLEGSKTLVANGILDVLVQRFTETQVVNN
jgi:phosphopantothenoylcysteine decarboxylase/phosphopantothenate--cysteine ligase